MGFQEIERQVTSKWSKKGSPYNSYNKLSYGLEREVPTKIHFALITYTALNWVLQASILKQ